MSSQVSQAIQFGGASLNLGIRLLYIPAAIGSWFMLMLQSWRSLLTFTLVGILFFAVGKYGGQIASTTINTMNQEIAPIYVNTVRPILYGVIREFFNRIICWFDGFLIFPYLVGKDVIFPILRDGGFGTTVISFAQFLDEFGRDFFLHYFANGRFLSQEFNYAPMFAKWQIFFTHWQQLWCFGCEDLCPYYTDLPVFIAFLTSDQYKDPAWGDFLGKTFNGNMVIIQQIIYQIREILFPTGGGKIFMNFDRAFELFCQGQTGLRVSFENILQEFWNAFIPYNFVWRDILCFFDTASCIILRSVNLLLNLIIHAQDVLNHFINVNSDYWDNSVKLQYSAIINLFGPAAMFAPIPLGNSTIVSYQLLTTSQSTPAGGPNPIYGEDTLGQCLCIALTRIICDPQANGTTCQQQYNNTLLSNVDPCCWTNNAGELVANLLTFPFELTLHLFSVPDFIEFANNQPFTEQVRDGIINTINCFWQFFRIVRIFGFCIQQILSEVTIFIFSTIDLLLRIIVALVTVPYYNEFLPGQCNLISCQNTTILDESLLYLDRIADPLLPDGFVNCMCFVLNTGFNVPYAGCSNVTCTPTGFIQPTNTNRRFNGWRGKTFRNRNSIDYLYTTSLYNITTRGRGRYARRLHGTVRPQFTLDAGKYRTGASFAPAFTTIDRRIESFGRKIGKCGRELISGTCGTEREFAPRHLMLPNFTSIGLINCTNVTNTTNPDPPIPCFGLCCLPVKLMQLAAHTISFGARAINAGFNTRFGNGSLYWNGQDCDEGKPCLASDLTLLVVQITAPVECLCEFIKLVLPSQGFGDPCCAFNLLGEVVACLFQIIINIGNSIAGDPNFVYIKGLPNSTADPEMITDFDIVLELALDLFDCVCNFIRTIFAVAFSGSQIFRAFDPCCVPRVFVRVGLEVFRLLLNLIVSLSTLDSPHSQCYLYVNDIYNARPLCPQDISDLGIVQQFRNLTSILFSPPTFDVTKQCVAGPNSSLGNITSLELQNEQGVSTCLCNTANALLSMIYMITTGFQGNLTQAPKCTVNLCCPIYTVGSVFFQLSNIVAETTASLWQNWRYTNIAGTNINVFVPMETLNYFFCDEYGSGASYTYKNAAGNVVIINNPGIYPGYLNSYVSLVVNHPMGGIANPNSSSMPGIVNPNAVLAAKCGRMEPALQEIVNLLGGCLCLQAQNGVANILDSLLTWLIAFASSNSQLFPFPVSWPGCLCNGGPVFVHDKGIIAPAAKAVVVFLRQVLILIRNIGNPTMWAPSGGTLTDPNYSIGLLVDNYADIRLTWINRFLAPLTDQLCILFRNAGCLLNMVLGNACTDQRFGLLGSITRYFMEGIIRIGSLIEGAIKLFTQEPPGLCVGGSNSNGNEFRPGDQGTLGQNGQLVPTCSPTGNFIMGSPTNSLDAGQLGRILNSILGFVADAFGGIARFGCTTVCPGFNTTKSYLLAQDFAQSHIIYQNQIPGLVCNCWQITPYSHIFSPGGQLCSFEVCNPYFNGNGTMNFTCPGGQSYCNAVDALSPPNTGLAQNATYEMELQKGPEIELPCSAFVPDETYVCATTCYMNGPNRVKRCISYGGACNSGCSNDPARFQNPSGVQYVPGDAVSWGTVYPQYPFVPKIDLYQPSGFRCEIDSPAFQNDTVAQANVLQAFGQTLFETIPFLPFPYSACVKAPQFCAVLCPGPDCIDTFTGTSFLGTPVITNIIPNWRALGEHTMCETSYAFHTGDGSGPYNHAIATDSNFAPFFGSCFLANLCNNEAEFEKWDPWFGSCIANNPALNVPLLPPTFANLPRWALSVTPVVMESLCMACKLTFRYNLTYGDHRLPASIQPACTKETCVITKQLCKNDQMIPCCPSDPSPLDGILVAGVKYFSCLMYATFGGFPAQIFDALGAIISLLWQISGGLNRLVSWFTVFVLATIVDLAQGIAAGGVAAFGAVVTFFFSWAPAIIGILAQFANIFGQSVILGFKRAPSNFTLRTPIGVMPIIDDAHDCMDNLCVCRVFDFDCSGNNLTTVNVLQMVKARFGGETACDMLFNHLIDMNPVNWTDLTYSNRYLATDCIAQRVKGEILAKASNGYISSDFFYDPISLFKLVGNILSSTTPHKKKKEEPRISTRFKEKFFMTREHFGRYINSRSVRLRDYYEKVLGMSDDSVALWPMMQLELFHFKWQTGYYHYLWDDMSMTNFQKNLGTPAQNWEHVKREFANLDKSMKYVYGKLETKLEPVVWGLKEKMPPMPSFLRILWDGSLLRSISLRMPDLYIPPINYQAPTLDWSWFSMRQVAQPRRALEAGKRIIYAIAHIIWPHYIQKETHDRFIINGDCRIVDGVINTGTIIVDYCLNDFVANTNTSVRRVLGGYLNTTSHLRNGFYRDFHGRIEYRTIGGWKRPRVITDGVSKRFRLPKGFVPLEQRTYHRARASSSGSSAISFINTLSGWIGVDIIQTIDQWVADFIYWMKNPHIEDAYYPDVGARYWAQHMIICKWPTSLNCAIGTGLGTALVEVGKIYGIAFLILVAIFPGLLSPLSIVFNVLVYFLFVSIVAWHYSPACLILFPTSNLGSTVWTVPVLPIPINIFPALPMCLWDDVIGILDEIFATCYTWIPQTILNNQQCVGSVSLPNCDDVGLTSPMGALAYWGYKIFGSWWCDFMNGLTSLFPYLGSTSTICAAIKDPSPTQGDRLFYCAIMSSGSLVLVGVGFYVVGTFIIAVVAALINALHAVILIVPTLPFYDGIAGMGSAQGVFEITGESEMPIAAEAAPPIPPAAPIKARFRFQSVGITDRISKFFQRAFVPNLKVEKME